MTAIRLFVARHGNTFEPGETCVQVGRRTDLTLATRGREQAENLARFFQEENIPLSKIYAGPLKRHQESAAIVKNILKLSCPIETSSALDEIDYGEWEGKTVEQLAEHYPDAYAAWQNTAEFQEDYFSGAESDIVDALSALLDRIQKNSSADDSVLLCTSQGLIRYFLKFVPGLWEELQRSKNFKNYKVKTGSFCEFLLSDRQLKLLSWSRSP